MMNQLEEIKRIYVAGAVGTDAAGAVGTDVVGAVGTDGAGVA
ncbi:hypothetical protein BVRB_2g032190 [Beta vulgaris subsp. vulgaris]|nr:hypothetical protein BVRB_2g032190 [Beta vulgaris subsp. vulgaris]